MLFVRSQNVRCQHWVLGSLWKNRCKIGPVKDGLNFEEFIHRAEKQILHLWMVRQITILSLISQLLKRIAVKQVLD